MTFTITYHEKVVKDDIKQLSEPIRLQIKQAIENKLTNQPETFGKPLRRSLKGYRKLRVGDYRIVFCISKSIIRILAILHRKEVYKAVKKRL